MTKQRGFTLIELLVVVAIIGILVGMVMIALNGAREKARDTQRKSDLRQLKSALELYHSDNQAYPIEVDFVAPSTMTDAFQPATGTAYIRTIPSDPRLANGAPDYQFISDDTGDNYVLWAQLENLNDPDRYDATTNAPNNGLTTAPGATEGFDLTDGAGYFTQND